MSWSVLLLVAPSSALAGWLDAAPMEASPEALLKAAEQFDGEGAAVEVLLDSTDVTFDGQGRRVQVFHEIYEIRRVDDAGSYGNVTAWWTQWYQERPDVQARVISPDGRVTVFDPATLVEELDGGNDPLIFQDSKRLRAPLPALRRGVVVEVVNRITDHAAFSEAGASVTRFVDTSASAPTWHAVFTARAPASVPLRLEAFGTDEKVKRKKKGGEVEYSLHVSWDTPDPDVDDTWRTNIALTEMPWAYAVASTIPDWGTAARTYHALVDTHVDPAGLEDVVAEVKAAPDRLEAIRRALRGVQDRIRYTGLEFGLQAIVPFTPAESVARGYGDCKDQASAVVAVLRAAGIDANLALLSTGTGAEVSPEPPAMRRFDHAIVVADGPDGPLWIDPTAPELPLGDLPLADQTRFALIIDPDTTDLVLTPAIQADYLEVRTVDLRTAGLARFTEEMTARGWTSHGMRYDFVDATARDVQTWLSDYAERTYFPSDPELVEVSLEPIDRDVPAVVTLVDVRGSELGAVSQTRAEAGIEATLLGNGLLDLGDDAFEVGVEANAGDDPYTMRVAPYRTRIQWKILLPPTFELSEELPDLDEDLGPIHLWREVVAGEGEVTVTYGAELTDTELSFAEGQAFIDAVGVEAYDERAWLAFVPRFLALYDEDEVEEAVAAGVEAMAAHGDDPAVAAVWTEVLGRMGFVDTSVRVARAITEAHPEAAVGWRALLATALRDPRGQFDVRPYDRTTALEAVGRLLTLDPSDWDAQDRALQLWLQGGDDGLDAVSDADLATAEEHLERWMAEAEEDEREDRLQELEIALRRVHYRQGRYEEVVGAPPPGASVDDWKDALESTAIVEGAEGLFALLQEAPEEYGGQLGEAVFVRLMGTPEGIEAFIGLMERVSGERGAPPQTQVLLDIFGRMEPWRAAVKPKDPRFAMLEMSDAVFVHADLKAAMDWMDFSGVDLPDDDVPPPDMMAGLAKEVLSGLPPELVVDLMAAMPFEVEDHPGGSHRLVTIESVDGKEIPFVVVGSGRKARVRATHTGSNPLVLDARRALDDGDITGADVFVDWTLRMMRASNTGPALVDLLGQLRSEGGAESLATVVDLLSLPQGDSEAITRTQHRLPDLDGSARSTIASMVALAVAKRFDDGDGEALQSLLADEDVLFGVRMQIISEVMDEDPTLARTMAERAHALRDHDADPLYQVMRATRRIDGIPAAIEKARAWNAAEPSMRAANELAWLLLLDDQVDEAIAAYEAARGRGGSERKNQLHTLALAYLLAGRVDDAQALFDDVRFQRGTFDTSWRAVEVGLLAGWGMEEEARLVASELSTDDMGDDTWELMGRLVDVPDAP